MSLDIRESQEHYGYNIDWVEPKASKSKGQGLTLAQKDMLGIGIPVLMLMTAVGLALAFVCTGGFGGSPFLQRTVQHWIHHTAIPGVRHFVQDIAIPGVRHFLNSKTHFFGMKVWQVLSANVAPGIAAIGLTAGTILLVDKYRKPKQQEESLSSRISEQPLLGEYIRAQ